MTIIHFQHITNKNDHENKKNNTFLHGGLDDLDAVLL